MSYKVWFITGDSRGFGRVWVDAALKRGDKVAATARTLARIADLKEKYGANVLTLELDVTKPDQVKKAVAQAHVHYCSSKWAFEAIHESLAAEVKPFGIKVTIIEPGAYATELGARSL
jgi:NAD(P)-dependent dehydrogenase (short-subunit alcohol dehydrogenase family)